LATSEAIFQVVDSENPPLRFLLGKYNLPHLRETYAERLAEWEKWEAVSNADSGLLTH
jgi:hypothetical protein